MAAPDPSAGVAVLGAAEAARELAALVDLLRDSVDGGASVGFLPPLDRAEAEDYWRHVIDDVAAGTRVLLGVRAPDGRLVGSAQLELAMRANGRHRAEVQKVMVHSGARQRGLGRALMDAAEAQARRRDRSTLVLDTRQGDPSERLYRAAGWTLGGTIPRYARSANGALHATAFYHKVLDAAASDGAAAPWTWTDADFAEMGWHDCLVHAVALPDAESHELALDLDYILEWSCPAVPAASATPQDARFRVAPVTLVFADVTELTAQLDTPGELQLDEIRREPAETIGAGGRAVPYPRWIVAAHGGRLGFRATGFTQYRRGAARSVGNSQHLTLAERGGISFARGRTDT
jgi:ribosomal protein S18 acetylase RimI-like enzyme